MRLLICAGGTGGGVYPALSVLQAIGDSTESILWVGSYGGMEADLIARVGIPYKAISAAGVHGVGLRSLPGNIVKLVKGTLQSRRILKNFRPDVLFFTGGFTAVPMAVAGRKMKSLLYVPDIEPGMALKAISRFADVISVTADESRGFFGVNQKVVTTGYPTRSDLKRMDKEEARKAFRLNLEQPTLLVLGGSKGAHSINQALVAVLPALLEKMQVIHITGEVDWEDIRSMSSILPQGLANRYRAFPFLHEEIGAAFSSADLAVCRAGASTLGELPLFGLPAILVPYPYAWRYQKVNADYLVGNGAAFLISDEELPQRLYSTVTSLISDEERLEEMGLKMSSLETPQAAARIAGLLMELSDYHQSGSEH